MTISWGTVGSEGSLKNVNLCPTCRQPPTCNVCQVCDVLLWPRHHRRNDRRPLLTVLTRRLTTALFPRSLRLHSSTSTTGTCHRSERVDSYLFDAHCCHMGTAIKHPVPDRVKPSFVIFYIRALRRSALSVRVPRCKKLQMTA